MKKLILVLMCLVFSASVFAAESEKRIEIKIDKIYVGLGEEDSGFDALITDIQDEPEDIDIRVFLGCGLPGEYARKFGELDNSNRFKIQPGKSYSPSDREDTGYIFNMSYDWLKTKCSSRGYERDAGGTPVIGVYYDGFFWRTHFIKKSFYPIIDSACLSDDNKITISSDTHDISVDLSITCCEIEWCW